MRKLKIAGAISSIIITSFLLVLLISPTIRSQIMSISGLAVAQSAIQWNNVKDAAVGDNLTNGLPATGLYIYDGTNWDMVRGTGGSIGVTSVGSKTPADAYANPTDATGTWALLGNYNGATWDRVRGDLTSGLWANIKATINLPVYTTISATFSTAQVTVDATEDLIRAINTSGRSIILRNVGVVDVYIGITGLSTATGFLVKAGESITLDRTTAAIYGITAAGSTTVAYLEE